MSKSDQELNITYKVNEEARTVTAYMFYDFYRDLYGCVMGVNLLLNGEQKVVGVARFKDGDTYDVEVGKRIARLKMLRQLNKLQKHYLEEARLECEERFAEIEKEIAHKDRVLENLDKYIAVECESPYKSK